VGTEDCLRLRENQAIFVGTKVDGQLRRRLESITGPDRKYFSRENTSFLTICKLGEDEYVGKVVEERLSTQRIDDVRRNVLSILQRLSPDTRFPQVLDILACDSLPE
jgi:hypothetical protein